MKIIQRPVSTTIIFGLICGIAFIPLNLVLRTMFFWPAPVCLSLWLFSAGYALLLSHWSNHKIPPVLYPLLVLFLAAVLVPSVAAFIVLALAVISWVRSGICYQERTWIRLAAEMLLCMVGGALIIEFTPASAYAWTLGIWMFFLLQALYFAIFDGNRSTAQNDSELGLDPFEHASRRVEDILSNGGVL
jgi:hypothetical protein